MALTQQRSEPQPASGAWTYDDLLALPDDGRRWEIIEGVLYEMPSPSWAHAAIIANLLLAWIALVRRLGGTIVTAPVDVFFPGAAPVQPDILVALPGNPGRPSRRGFEGAPDLVVEVLSPSTRRFDLLLKRSRLEAAGCEHYWVVDPDEPSITAWTLVDGTYREVARAAGAESFDLGSPFPVSFTPSSLLR